VHSFRCIRQIMSKCFRKQNTMNINIKYKQHKWSRTLIFSLKHGAPIWYRSRLFGGCCSHPRSYPTFCRTKHLRLSPIDLPQPQTCFFTIKISWRKITIRTSYNYDFQNYYHYSIVHRIGWWEHLNRKTLYFMVKNPWVSGQDFPLNQSIDS